MVTFFSEVYDGNFFEISEPKTEPLHLPIPWGQGSKSEKSMFFGPASLNIIQNFIFKVWIEQDDSWTNFDIHKWSPFWSPCRTLESVENSTKQNNECIYLFQLEFKNFVTVRCIASLPKGKSEQIDIALMSEQRKC